MKRYIRAAAETDDTFDNQLSELKEDFDYILSGLEKLGRSGANATNAGKAIAENIQSSFSQFIDQIGNSISEE